MEAAAASLTCFSADEDAPPAAPNPSIEVREVADTAPIASIVAADAIHPRLRRRWLDLAENASEPNCFAEAWFLEASLRHLDRPGDLRLVTVFGGHQGSVLLGVMPLHVTKPYGRLPVRHVANWMHFHSFLGTPMVREGHEQQFWSAILDFLDGSEWAKGFLHVSGLVEGGPVHRGLADAARLRRRSCSTVFRSERALLESRLAPEDYYQQTVRKKKRKELKRLSARLHELGTVEFRTLGAADEVHPWAEDFLRLERSGWKGERGSALACSLDTEQFFVTALDEAHARGRLDFLRLDLDGKAIAMLVNFTAAPGSFSFKIAIDEAYARFSPGVLIQIENYRVLTHPDIGWMDSCAAEDHPMINSLWGERRALVRVTVPLAGTGRRTIFLLCRLAERASAALRGLRRRPKPVEVNDDD